MYENQNTKIMNQIHKLSSDIGLFAKMYGYDDVYATRIAHSLIFDKRSPYIMYIDCKMSLAYDFKNKVKIIIKDVLKDFPKCVSIKNDNKMEISFNHGSNLKVRSATIDALRGYSINQLFINNSNLIRNYNDVYSSLIPCLVSRNSSFHLIS